MTKRRHHYVPRYYLKGFTNAKKLIWAYSINGREPFSTGVARVGMEKHFYTVQNEDGSKDSDSIEDYLANQIENPANIVIRKLRKEKSISANEKYDMATYLMSMLTRVPKSRTRLKEGIMRITEDKRQIFKQAINTTITDKPPADRKRLTQLREQMMPEFDLVKEELIQELSLPYLDEGTIAAIHIMKWILVKSAPGKFFVTSDNPFCFTEHLGLLMQDAHFLFPISSKLALLGHWMEDVPNFAIGTHISKDANHTFNQIIIESAFKYVYHHSKHDWVSEMIKEMHPISEQG